jgi:hypothetical protein
MVRRLTAGRSRIRTIGPAPAKGSSGRCQSAKAARKAEPLTSSGPKRQCLPEVVAHSLSLRGGTVSSNPSSSSRQSVSRGISPSGSEKAAVAAAWAGRPGGTARRDAQGASTSRQAPAISLSGPIPVPQCRLGRFATVVALGPKRGRVSDVTRLRVRSGSGKAEHGPLRVPAEWQT